MWLMEGKQLRFNGKVPLSRYWNVQWCKASSKHINWEDKFSAYLKMIRFAGWGVFSFVPVVTSYIYSTHMNNGKGASRTQHNKAYTRLAAEWKLKNMYPNILCDFSSTSHSLWLSRLMCTFSSRQKPIACVFCLHWNLFRYLFVLLCGSAMALEITLFIIFMGAWNIWRLWHWCLKFVSYESSNFDFSAYFCARPIFTPSKSFCLHSYQPSNIFRADSVKQLKSLFILHLPPQDSTTTESI